MEIYYKTHSLLLGSFFILVFVVLGMASVANTAYAATDAVPTLINAQPLTLFAPEDGAIVDSAIFLITGTAPLSGAVEVYVDNILDGKATMVPRGNYAYYTYELRQELEDKEHTLAVMLRGNITSRIERNFIIRQKLAAPTILAPGPGLLPDPEPIVVGITPANTSIRLLVDNEVVQEISPKRSANKSESFAFDQTATLSVGKHTIAAQTFLDAERTSDLSEEVIVEIQPYYPAPTLLEPVINAQTTLQRPYIQGLAFNDSSVYLMVDGASIGEFPVVNDASGTAHFAVRMPYALTAGEHTLSARAKDSKGSVLSPTSYRTFIVAQPRIEIGASEETFVGGSGGSDGAGGMLGVAGSGSDVEEGLVVEKATTTPILEAEVERKEDGAKTYKGMGWWVILAGIIILLWIWFGGKMEQSTEESSEKTE